MKLKSLDVRASESWENWKGYRGKLHVTGPDSEVQINLSDESCRKVLELVATGISEAAAQTATFLRNEALGLQLEAPAETLPCNQP